MQKLFLSLFLYGLAVPYQASAGYSFKEEIKKKEEYIANLDKSEVAPHLVDLAIAYIDDQNQEESFKTYLRALDNVKQINNHNALDGEETFYKQALDSYLYHPGSPAPTEIAEKIEDNYSNIISEHPDYYQLAFLCAIAKANLGKYKEFYKLFYKSYERYPEHYLAYKTKAILHLKLLERGRTNKEREEHRQKVIENVTKAVEKNEKDTGLYKLLMLFATDEQKSFVVDACLNKIIKNSILVPRSDIAFFVKQAMALGKKELAQSFIDKAKEWYHYSKVINAAQEFVDNKK